MVEGRNERTSGEMRGRKRKGGEREIERLKQRMD